MKFYKTGVLSSVLLVMLSTHAYACNMNHESTKHKHMHMQEEKGSKSGFCPAMMKMSESMKGIKTTGNPDLDFAQHMIPHHEAAIDMATIELEKGKDPKIQEMAKDMIKTQMKEITDLKKWIAEKKSAK